MASGAHVTSSNQQPTPNIFEVIAQERLSELIPAALNHVTTVLVNRYPVLATYVQPEHLVLAAHSALETHFLFTQNASAAEHFYDLERVNPQGALTSAERLKSLAIVCLLPYIREKLKTNLTIEPTRSNNNRARLLKLLSEGYRYISAFLQAWDFFLSIRYLMGKTEYQSLEQLFSGTVLRRSGPKEKTKYGLVRAAGTVLTYSVTAAVFFVQFLQWWREHGKRGTDSTPIPPVPVHLLDKPGPCRLCHNEVVNPAALSTSGYVFCYPCIYRYLMREGKCPVTGYPSTVDCLVRLHTTGS